MLVSTFCKPPLTEQGGEVLGLVGLSDLCTLIYFETIKRTLESQRTDWNVTFVAHVSDVGLILTNLEILQSHKKKENTPKKTG